MKPYLIIKSGNPPKNPFFGNNLHGPLLRYFDIPDAALNRDVEKEITKRMALIFPADNASMHSFSSPKYMSSFNVQMVSNI